MRRSATTAWSFTTQAPPPITITSRSPASGATNVNRSGPVTVTFSVPIANGYAMTLRVGTTAVAGTVARSADQRTLTFTPTGLMPASSTVTVTLTGVVSTDGVALGTQTWTFGTAPRPTLTQTLFTGLTPAQTSTNTRAVEVGTHFTTSVAGNLTAIRFYKASQDTGTHTVAALALQRHPDHPADGDGRVRLRLADQDLDDARRADRRARRTSCPTPRPQAASR